MMGTFSSLESLLVFLAIAVGIVAIARKCGLPTIMGYLATGILVGPYALAWVPDTPDTRHLAEFGVVFLMFSIGLEFNLARLVAMRSALLGIGLVQVILTLVVGVLFSIMAGWGWQFGVVVGGAWAMSSTAILAKTLNDRLEQDSPHGRDIIGVLLFQDLAVVPLLIIFPSLSQISMDLALHLTQAILKSVLVLMVVFWLGRRVLRVWITIVARRHSHELFVLNILLMTLGLAWFTQYAGISLALGAFVAGMVISETEFRYQVEQDIRPFRDVLLGLFFVTIGMLLDVRTLLANWGWVLLLAGIPLILKFLCVMAIGYRTGRSKGTILRTALALAPAGEFAFVLLAEAAPLGLTDPWLYSVLVNSMLLSILLTPGFVSIGNWAALRWGGDEWMLQSLSMTQTVSNAMQRDKHVLICGYGRNGQGLARLLKEHNIGYIALDLDPERVREASMAGEAVIYADANQKESLILAGLMRASMVVITYRNTASSLKVLSYVQSLRPNLSVIVHSNDDSDMDRLRQAGATEVVPQALEASLMLASHALLLSGVSMAKVIRRTREIRASRYGLLRGFFHGTGDEGDEIAEQQSLHLHTVSLHRDAVAINVPLSDLHLERVGVDVLSIRRSGGESILPTNVPILQEGDVLILKGMPSGIALAERILLVDRGSAETIPS